MYMYIYQYKVNRVILYRFNVATFFHTTIQYPKRDQ